MEYLTQAILSIDVEAMLMFVCEWQSPSLEDSLQQLKAEGKGHYRESLAIKRAQSFASGKLRHKSHQMRPPGSEIIRKPSKKKNMPTKTIETPWVTQALGYQE